MKAKPSLLIIISLLIVFTTQVYGQVNTNVCALITTEQIHNLFGCNVKDGTSTKTKNSARCQHVSSDGKKTVYLEYYDYGTGKAALGMMKMTYDYAEKDIQSGKKTGGVYTVMKPFAEGGPYAMVLTGEGSEYTNGNVVRLQFVLGSCKFVFNVEGTEMKKVVSKLGEVYTIIKNNYH